jgi:hypothetical protein
MALGRRDAKASAQNNTPELPPDEAEAVATVESQFKGMERAGEVVKRRPVEELAPEQASQPSAFDADTMRELSDFDEAVRLATEAYGPVVQADQEIGDGFAILGDKSKGRLVNVPLLFMEWSFYPGDFGTQFVAARVVARNPDGGVSRYIVNDGSTGIADQLAAYSKRTGKYGALMVKKGLRVSEYTYCELCRVVNCELPDAHKSMGQHKKAETYYLDTSA